MWRGTNLVQIQQSGAFHTSPHAHVHTSHTPPTTHTRFMAAVEVDGSGSGVGPDLVECFPCTTGQQLINRTCTDAEPPPEERQDTGLLNV